MQACTFLTGEGGYLPKDFPFIEMCKEYRQLPWEVAKGPAVWIKRMMFEHSVQKQAEHDRAANDEARAKAGIK